MGDFMKRRSTAHLTTYGTRTPHPSQQDQVPLPGAVGARRSATGRTLYTSVSEVPDVLTVAEAAHWIGVKPKTVRLWIKKGILKARKIGRIIRIRRVDLERLFCAE